MNCCKCNRTDLSAGDFYKGNRWVCRSCVCAQTTANRRSREQAKQAAKLAARDARIASGLKTCSKCGLTKKRADFYPKSDGFDGLFGHCRECHYSAGKRWRRENPSKSSEYALKRRMKDPAGYRAKSLSNYYKYRDQWAAQRKRYAAQHPRKYGPEQLLRAHRRRARLKGNGGERVTLAEWQVILDVFGHRCAYCLRTDAKLTQDHVVALCRGGAHSRDNLVPACQSCNSRKSSRPVFFMVNACGLGRNN